MERESWDRKSVGAPSGTFAALENGEYVTPAAHLAIDIGLEDQRSARTNLTAYVEDGGNGFGAAVILGPLFCRLAEYPTCTDVWTGLGLTQGWAARNLATEGPAIANTDDCAMLPSVSARTSPGIRPLNSSQNCPGRIFGAGAEEVTMTARPLEINERDQIFFEPAEVARIIHTFTLA